MLSISPKAFIPSIKVALLFGSSLAIGCSSSRSPSAPLQHGVPFHTSTQDVFASGITQQVSKNFGICGKDLKPCVQLSIQVDAPPPGLSEETRNFIATVLEKESTPLKRSDWLRADLLLDENGSWRRYTSLEEFLSAFIAGFQSSNKLLESEVVQGPIAPGENKVETTLVKQVDTTTLDPWLYAIRMGAIPSLPSLVSYRVHRNEVAGTSYNQHSTSYLHFSKSEPKQLLLNDLIQFEKLPQFMKVAERHFRNSHNVFTEESLNNHGFKFPDGSFKLAENFFINKKALHLVYQPGEIADVERGTIAFAIPIQTVERFLNIAPDIVITKNNVT